MNEDLLEILGDRLTDRIQKANTYYLTKIGEMIKRIRDLKPTQAQQLIQILKYGGSYEDILMEISSLTGIDPIEIDRIFAQYSRNDLNFAKKFYDYRNIPFIPFDENIALKRQTEALANITKNAMNNFTRSRALGYTIRDINGVPKFYGLRETYEKVLDEALLNTGQGKESFDSSMSRILKELGSSGLKTLDYSSGRHIRLDSMVRMHLKSGLRELHNETQRLVGEEFGADGVEISVHLNPAEDHQDAQGRQFSYTEFNKLQDTGIATTYQGKEIDMTTGVEKISHRPISEYNCYHYTFAIVLGVSKPLYTDEQLNQIIKDNKKGFEYEGKHYTMYEGTQIQRELERRIREQKDIQILAKESDNQGLIADSQKKITQLSRKYKELSNVSGLPTKENRLRVSTYKRTKVELSKVVEQKSMRSIEEWNRYFGEKYGSFDLFLGNVPYKENGTNWVEIDKNLEGLDERTLNDCIYQFEKIYDKYNLNNQGIKLAKDLKNREAVMYTTGTREICFCDKMYNREAIIDKMSKGTKSGYSAKGVSPDDYIKYPITHEMGHIIENRYIDNIGSKTMVDNDIKNEIITNVMHRTKMSKEEIIDKYFTKYAKSKETAEWFAESFAQLELGEKNIWVEEFEKWLKNNL